MTALEFTVEIGLATLLLTGCASYESMAHDQFVGKYSCPAEQVSVEPKPKLATGYTPIDVKGCGYTTQYQCGVNNRPHDRTEERTCDESELTAFQSTDGTLHETALGDADFVSIQKDAVLASAAHDLPCDRASIVSIGGDIYEGCGQRVTYKSVTYDVPPPTKPAPHATGYRYVLVARIATPPTIAPNPPAP